MSNVISIDPGKRHAGVAIWEHTTLTRAYLAQSPKDAPWLSFLKQLPPMCQRGYIEIPQVFPGQPARHEDLLQLAASAGAIAGYVRGDWEQIRPAVWTKKTCSKKGPRIERALARLSETELARIEWPSTKLRREDVGDAIALGLYALKRF